MTCGQVDREDEDGRRAGGDRLVARLAETVVEAAAPLAQRSGAGCQGELADRRRRASRRASRRCPGVATVAPDRGVGEAGDEVAPLLRVEDRAEPGLRAVEAPDRDDRDDVEAPSIVVIRPGGAGELAAPRRPPAPAPRRRS